MHRGAYKDHDADLKGKENRLTVVNRGRASR